MATSFETESDNSTERVQWLRAAVLGANDGLVSVAALMMGVGAVKADIKTMLFAGFAGLVSGACSMAIGEFVSVYTQRDIEVAQLKRESYNYEVEVDKHKFPNPAQAAVASALAFIAGAVVPLLGAIFIKDYKLRIGVVVAVVSLALVVFGAVGAVLGRTSIVKSSVRVLIGGLIAMGITYGMTKLIGTTGLESSF